ncbi:MAG: RNA polymerase sigma factor FliA [Gammaproteobacteria bacterium]|nr:RNA polymerase sigma factor FliA [Gammaproteobacteria bacterium]MCP4994521.1 RNA polymerase sigma factor FliA [Gammaproteobacteria bacterium]
MNGLATYAKVQQPNSDALVYKHAPLVKRIAYHMLNRLPPNVQVDDLIQAGMIGLLEASRNYDPTQGATFETYAGIRIRGAMLDEIRRSDWTPRSVHRKARMVADAMREIENSEGRDARDIEVAERLELSLDDYHRILQDSSGCRIFSVEELQSVGELPQDRGEGAVSTPLDGIQHDAFKLALADAIAGLPERERLVIGLYYDEELNLREIGKVIGVSESRVCQIHSQAALRLRSRLAEWLADLDLK